MRARVATGQNPICQLSSQPASFLLYWNICDVLFLFSENTANVIFVLLFISFSYKTFPSLKKVSAEMKESCRTK